MEDFARDVLIEYILNGDIQSAQKILLQMRERGLEIIVQKTKSD